MKKMMNSILMAFLSFLMLSSFSNSPTNETEKRDALIEDTYDAASDITSVHLNVEDNYKKSSIMAGCKGNACKFVQLSATYNSNHHITSITIDNVSSKPVDVRVEFQTIFGDIKPWRKYIIPANGRKTYSVDTYFQYIGGSIKRASEITN